MRQLHLINLYYTYNCLLPTVQQLQAAHAVIYAHHILCLDLPLCTVCAPHPSWLFHYLSVAIMFAHAVETPIS